jgi:hypothetical protein
MAKDRLSMRKLKEVLRLKFDHQLTNRNIAKSCAISHVTVGKYLEMARQAGITWPLPDDIDDARLGGGGSGHANKMKLLRIIPKNRRFHHLYRCF